MWKWVGPIVMFIIFISSVILQVINPLRYTVYTETVSACQHVLRSTKKNLMQYEEREDVYPEWGLFIGALIILSSVLVIPFFLVVRLVAYQSAREEGMEFILRVFHMCKEAIQFGKELPGKVKELPEKAKRIPGRVKSYYAQRYVCCFVTPIYNINSINSQ